MIDFDGTIAITATYLGDGLYASFDGYQIKLFAHNGISETDAIYIEPATLLAFERLIANFKAKGWAP